MVLKGKTTLITGGGTGIGAAVARRFVTEGAKVCITGINKNDLDAVSRSLPEGSVATCVGDVSVPEDVRRMTGTALEFGGRIDVLLNCAAVSLAGSVTEIDFNDWKRSLDVNLTGPFLMMRAAIPHMINSGGGSVINVSSLAGLRCLSGLCAYTASKGALISLTQQAALDYGKYNIRINAICPGFVMSAMSKMRLEEITEGKSFDIQSLLSETVRDLPLRFVGEPESITGLCCFLASDDSSYMTGAAIPIDGGACITDAFGVGMNRAVAKLDP